MPALVILSVVLLLGLVIPSNVVTHRLWVSEYYEVDAECEKEENHACLQ